MAAEQHSTPIPSGESSRRALLAGTAALMAPAVPAVAATDPDAELIAACRAYVVAIRTYNGEGGGRLDPDACPLWAAVEAAGDRAENAPPAQTWAGVRAMAEVARAMAQEIEPGQFDYSDSYCGDWPGKVVEAALRLTATRA